MKRILPVLVLVLALGGAAVYYVQKQGLGVISPLAAAAYLPGGTVVMLAIPDPAQTAKKWKTTDLYKIWSEPDVQAFLAKPLSLIPPDKNRDDTLAQIGRLQPRNLFAALTSLDGKTNEPHFLAGFQFKGASGDVDHLIAPAKDALRQKFPAGKADLISYQGHSVETFLCSEATAGGNPPAQDTTVASVYVNDWYLISNDVALLKTTIDRLEHRSPANAPALDQDGDFRAVNSRLPAGYETFIFGRVQPFMGRIFALAAASGQPVDPQARAEAEKGRAMGATTKIEGGKIRDTIYYLAPGLLQGIVTLQMNSLALTSTETLLYFAEVFRLPKQIDLPVSPAGGTGGFDPMSLLKGVGQQLQAKGLTLEAARAAFGEEVGFQLDWPASHSQPTALFSISVRNADAAAKFVDGLASMPVGEAVWETKKVDGSTMHVLTIPNIDAFKPTLTVTGKSVILGLNVNSVKDAAAREGGSAPNFTQTEAYKTATGEVGKASLVFAYLDTKSFFERFYGVVKPVALLGAAFLYPQANDYVDLSKLPPVEAVAKHLSPTVMSAALDSQGELIESTGSVTLFQASVTVIGGTTALAVPVLQSKFGSLFSAFGNSPAAAAAPGAGPSPLPAQSPAAQSGAAH